MSTQSSLSKFPIKQLVLISERLIDDDFDFQNPYDEYDESISKLKNIMKYFDRDALDLDMEFMAKFIEINYNILLSIKDDGPSPEKYKELSIPQANKYKAYYEISGSAFLTEKYYDYWDSYDESFVKDNMYQQRNDGNWDYWDGHYIENETDNFDSDNFEVTYISLNESRKDLLSKLVVENTEELIDKIDRDSLIKLRNLINRKLSS
jgi:hypothetical protein